MLKTLMNSTTAGALMLAFAPLPAAAQKAAADSPECSVEMPQIPCLTPEGEPVVDVEGFRTFAVAELGDQPVEPVLEALQATMEGAPATDEAPSAEEMVGTEAGGEAPDAPAEATAEAPAQPEQAAAEPAPAAEPAEEQAAPAEEPAADPEPAEEQAAPAEEPAADPAPAEEQAAPAEEPAADPAPAEEQAAPAEEPAADPAPAEEPAAEQAEAPAEEPAPDAEVTAETDEAAPSADDLVGTEAGAEAEVQNPAGGEEVVGTEEAMDGADENMTTEAPVATAEAELQEDVDGDLPACDFVNPTLPCVTDEGQILSEVRQFRDYIDATPGQNRRDVMQRLRANLGLPSGEETPSAAAAAAEGEAPEGEVVTEQVTEENSRQADEEFDTAVNENVEATDDEDDDGLDNFQRALLVGLGAVAVGSILNNGNEVVANTGDRIIVDTDAGLQVLKNDDALLRQPGAEIRTENFADGSSRTFVDRADGSQVVTIRAADGRVLRRSVVFADGSEVQLFDDTAEATPVEVSSLPPVAEQQAQTRTSDTDEEALRAALMAQLSTDVGRTFSLQQVRQYQEVRALAPQVALDSVTFATGSAAIDQRASDDLVDLGVAISSILDEDPSQVFLIEGHTDTVGDAGYNLALSDRRAETVALALTQFFDVPPENLITQGYGESDLLIEQEGDIRENRRAAVRNITGLLR